MKARELSIPGAWVFSPAARTGRTGSFVEPYSSPEFAGTVGHPLSLGHLNVSAASAGTLRGIHYGEVPPGQAKYVTCVAGAVWDVVVDLRVGSRTFGAWEPVLLDAVHKEAVYLSEGLGHGYLSLADNSVLVYVCSQPYLEGREHRINAFDAQLGIAWPTVGTDGHALDYITGRQDGAAPTLQEARDRAILPDLSSVRTWVSAMTTRHAETDPRVTSETVGLWHTLGALTRGKVGEESAVAGCQDLPVFEVGDGAFDACSP